MQKLSKNNLILALTCGTHGVQDGISTGLNLVLPLLAQLFGLSYAEVGMLRAVKSGAMALFEIPSGVLAESIGERRLLVFGLICTGLGGLLLAGAGSIVVVLAAFVIIGIGNAFQHALSSAVISRNFGLGKRRAALGLYNSAGDAGKLGFTGLIALATGIGLAWQGMVVFFGAITLGLAVLLWLVFTRMDVGGPRPKDQAPAAKGWGILDKRGFANLCLTVSLDIAVQSGFMVFLVFVMVEKGIALHLSGFALVLTLIGGMFGKAGCGYLAQKIGVRPAFILAQILTALGIYALLTAPPLYLLAILPLLGMFLQGSTSITYGTVADLIQPDKHSRGFALIYSVSGISSIIGPIAFGVISDIAGLNTSMAVMAGIALLAIIPSLFLRSGEA